MKDLLAKYYNLEECVLLDVRWKQWGFSLELVFDYIWKEKDVVRNNLDVEDRVVVRFSAVQEFHASYEWNHNILSEPKVLDWGSAEVARVCLENSESFLAKYHSRPMPFHHVAVRWESERRMDVVFSELEIFRE
jgi:hypothetical protein